MGCVDSLKSTFGYIFSLVVGAMSWKSIKQTITASSMMEVKLIAHHQAMSQAIWLRNFIIVSSISKPIKINCDNFVAVFFSKNNKCSSKSKHIKLKYHVVRDKVQF